METKDVRTVEAILALGHNAPNPTEDELIAALWKLVEVDPESTIFICRRLQHYRRNEQHLESELGKAALRRLLAEYQTPDRLWRLLRRLEALRDKTDQVPGDLRAAIAACLYAFFEENGVEERDAKEAFDRILPDEQAQACVLVQVAGLAGC